MNITGISTNERYFLSSQELDLSDAATFRDLSKPMGAQTPDRLKQFKKRYTDWDDPTGKATCSKFRGIVK